MSHTVEIGPEDFAIVISKRVDPNGKPQAPSVKVYACGKQIGFLTSVVVKALSNEAFPQVNLSFAEDAVKRLPLETQGRLKGFMSGLRQLGFVNVDRQDSALWTK